MSTTHDLRSLGLCSLICLTIGGVLGGCAGPAGKVAETASKAGEIPVTTGSGLARGLFEEGEYLLDVGRGVEAREKFQAAVAEDPGFAYAHYNLSNAALSFQEFQECVDNASASLEGASDGERLLVEMNETFLTNDTDRGVELASELVEQYPASSRAWVALGARQAGQNDNEAARESFAKALELDAESVAAIVGMATNYVFGEPKDFAKAEVYARAFVTGSPKEAKAYEMLGDVKRARKDLTAALEAYTLATETDANLAVAHLKKGHVNSFLGNIEEARAAYDAGFENAKPENKSAYANYRAFTHIHGGDVQAALDELEHIAETTAEMGTPEGQVKGLQVFALTNHATAALHAGELDQAAEAIAARNALQREIGLEVATEDSVRLQEVNCNTWDGLLAAYRGDADAAAEYAGAIAELVADDDNPRKMEPHHWVMGMASLKQGDYEQAVEHLRQADYRNTMFVRYHLALAEEGAGNVEEAREMFREVAEWNFNSVGFALVHEDAAARAAG